MWYVAVTLRFRVFDRKSKTTYNVIGGSCHQLPSNLIASLSSHSSARMPRISIKALRKVVVSPSGSGGEQISFKEKPSEKSNNKNNDVNTTSSAELSSDGSKAHTKNNNKKRKSESFGDIPPSKKELSDFFAPKEREKKSSKEASSLTLSESSDFNNDRTVYIEGLPFDSSAEDVEKIFSSCGKIVQIRLPTWHDSSRLLGYGHILFSNAASRKKALELDGTYLKNRYIKVQEPLTPKVLQKSVHSEEGSSSNKVIKAPAGCKTVFVKNLPYDATENDVIESLRVCGPINKVRLAVWGHTEQLKGFGYVDFKREESAEIAVKKSGILAVKGRKVICDFETGAPKASYKSLVDAKK